MTKFFERNKKRLKEDVQADHKVSENQVSPLHGRQRLKSAAKIDLDCIEVDPQHRETFEEDALENLANSMKDHGQLQPVRVRWDEERGKYVIIAGERRFRAAQIAELGTVDCVVVEGDLSPSDLLREQIIENALREDLKPTEQARAFRDLMESQNWSAKELSQQIHVSQPTISRSMKLLLLPQAEQQKVDSGEIATRDAIRELQKSSSPTSPTSRKKRVTKERKFVTSVGTLTLKSRRLITDDVWVNALREALAESEEKRAESKAA